MTYRIITDFEELPQFDPNKPIFWDIETGGLYTEPRLIQMYQPDTDSDIIIYDLAKSIRDISTVKDKLKILIPYLKSLHLVAYNGSYDLGTLNFVPKKIDDLFYAVKSAYPHFMEFGLGKVTEKLAYTRNLYNGIDKSTLQKKGFKPGAYLSKVQYTYSAIDVYALSLMWTDPKIQFIIQENMAYKVDIISQGYCVQYQQNGLQVPQDMVQDELATAEEEIDGLKSKIPEGLNVNSPKQVKEYLGTEGASKEVLLRSTHKDAPTIMKLKKRMKEFSYLNSINYSEMVTKFNPAGAVTGRFTSSGGDIENGFNAQQIPRRFQYLFNSDIDDTTVVHFDYGTLELRVAASIWGISKMRDFFNEDKDLHTEMAMIVTGKERPPSDAPNRTEKGIMPWGDTTGYVTEEDRQWAKACNFGFIFGMSATSFVQYAYDFYEVKFSDNEASIIQKKFFTAYPEARAWHSYVWNNFKKPTFIVETALGRRVKPRMGTDGINIPVQGTGAEVTKLALHYLVKENPEAIKYIFNCVHDAIYLRVKKSDKKIWEERLSKAMIKGWDEIKKTKLFKFKDIEMKVAL